MAERSSQSGFILVASIWLLVVLLLIAGLFGVYVSTQVAEAGKAKARTVESLDWVSTEQTLLYLFSVNGMSRKGLLVKGDVPATLRLDGSEYRGWGDVRFSVNDFGGLVGVNVYNNLHLDQLLRSFEVSESGRRKLLDGLYDYVDMDDLIRLNGYEGLGSNNAEFAPTNDLLKTIEELENVVGWQAFLNSYPGFRASDWLSTNWRSRLNLNTIPSSLFSRVLPIDEEEARRLIKARNEAPFKNMDSVDSLLRHRVGLIDDYYTFIPTGDVRFRVYSAKSHKVSTFVVLYTPMSVRWPWVIDYRYQSENRTNRQTSSRDVAREYFERKSNSAG